MQITWLVPCLGLWRLLGALGPVQGPWNGTFWGQVTSWGQDTLLGANHLAGALLGALAPAWGPGARPGAPWNGTPRGGRTSGQKPLGLGCLPLYAACIRYGY